MLVAVLVLDLAWAVMGLVRQTQLSTQYPSSCDSTLRLQRARILAQLKQDGGRDLVIVRYGPRFYSGGEWVYNEADIDKAEVVWAREMDAAQNRKLIEYFADRNVWLLEMDHDGSSPVLTPYPVASIRDSP